jgi:uncharacterized RDD family membrane protein YckC
MYCPNCGFKNEDTVLSCSKCDTNLSSIPLEGIRKSPYVGFWNRFYAAFIDWIVSNILVLILGIGLGLFGIFIPWLVSDISILLFSILVAFIYHAGFESSKYQATIGKQVIGIKVTDLEGNRISFGRAFFRHFTKVVTSIMLGIGYFAIIFSKKKQGLYDMAAGTVVINGR